MRMVDSHAVTMRSQSVLGLCSTLHSLCKTSCLHISTISSVHEKNSPVVWMPILHKVLNHKKILLSEHQIKPIDLSTGPDPIWVICNDLI